MPNKSSENFKEEDLNKMFELAEKKVDVAIKAGIIREEQSVKAAEILLNSLKAQPESERSIELTSEERKALDIINIFAESEVVPESYHQGFGADCDQARNKEGKVVSVNKPETPRRGF